MANRAPHKPGEMCGGEFDHTVSAAVAHQVLMIIEGLLGHLQEDVSEVDSDDVRRRSAICALVIC